METITSHFLASFSFRDLGLRRKRRRWREIGAQIHHTYQSGNITIISDGENIRVKTVR